MTKLNVTPPFSTCSDPEIWFYKNQKSPDNISPRIEVSDGFFIETLAGVTYDNRQEKIKNLNQGDKLVLEREPANIHDTNAIRVLTCSGDNIGYIKKIHAAFYAPFFDIEKEPLSGEVVSILPGFGTSSFFDVTIKFKVNSFNPPNDVGVP